MNNEQNKPFPFAALLISWLFGGYDEEIIKKYLKSLPTEKIDEIIEIVKETPVEDKYKETTINELLKCKNNSCDMTQEDYCSFELSKLLKDKGFDWMCNGYYNKDDEDSEPYFGDGEGADNWNNQAPSVRDLWFSAPTHQMAMRFLRKIKKIFINIRYVPESKDDNIGPCYVVDIYNENNGSWVPNHIVTISFEEAAEESLTFCLTELI